MLMSKEIIGLYEKYNKDIKDIWILDSGDTSHMTNNPNGLYNVEECLEKVEYGKMKVVPLAISKVIWT